MWKLTSSPNLKGWCAVDENRDLLLLELLKAYSELSDAERTDVGKFITDLICK